MPAVLFCPCPPVLVPEVAQGAADELAGLLSTCDHAIRTLLEEADDVVVVGPGPVAGVHPDEASGTLAGFGVPVRAGGSAPPRMPLALTMGAWLLDRSGATVARRYVEVGPAGSAPEGPWLSGAAAVLVMGDGTARLTERAPGGLDPAAAGYDEVVVAALAGADPAALAALDLDEGARMMAAGVPAWRAVGVALGSARRPLSGTLLAREAPFGVSYVVAQWL